MIKMGMALDPQELRLIDEYYQLLKEGKKDALLLARYGQIQHLYGVKKDTIFLTPLSALEERGYRPPENPFPLPSKEEVVEYLHAKNEFSFRKKLDYLQDLCDQLLAERVRRELLGLSGFDLLLKKYGRALSLTEDKNLRSMLKAYSQRNVRLYPIGEVLCVLF